ncbi:MAG: hypothetical protein ACI39U_07395 [Candidatus Cryptobacteroides sp.]
MAEGNIDLKKLTVDELSGVVGIYPWFAAARRELCLRLARSGEEDGRSLSFKEAALHVPDRRKLVCLLKRDTTPDYSDVIEERREEQPVYRREVRPSGGDFFSQSDYENVKLEEDGKLIESLSAHKWEKDEGAVEVKDLGFYTETLAAIYAEQGYYGQAEKIYSQLILAYPEKSAYFASLIEKLKNN